MSPLSDTVVVAACFITALLPLKVKFASPFKLTPLPPVMILLSALFAIVACAGKLVKFAPEPLNVPAVNTLVLALNLKPSSILIVLAAPF